MIDFSNASLLSFNQQTQLLGDNYNYRTIQQLGIQGYILNLDNTQGVSGIWSGISGFVENAIDYDGIILNGINFGSGKINSITFGESNDVQVKNYSANITIYTTGNLFNFTPDLSGLNTSGFNLINNFGETFVYSNNEANISGYRHNITISANAFPNFNPLSFAKSVASGLFNLTNLTGVLGNYHTIGKKKYYRENYNLITNDCQFEESVDFVNALNDYSWQYTHNITTAEDGVTTVTEEGNIRGQVIPLETSLEDAINAVKTNAYTRCNNVFTIYAPTNAYSLNTQYVNRDFNISTFDGTATYKILFTNSPKFKNTYFWDKTIKIDRTENDIYTVSEQGTIQGLGRKMIGQYQNALAGWNIINGGIYTRLDSYYLSNSDNQATLYIVKSVLSQSLYQGNITYSTIYTDNPIYTNENGIKQISINVTDDMPVPLINRFLVVNQKELAQNAYIPTIGKRSLSMNLIGGRTVTPETYLSTAISEAHNLIPTDLGDDVYLNECKYSLAIPTNVFHFNCAWVFHNDKDFSDTGV